MWMQFLSRKNENLVEEMHFVTCMTSTHALCAQNKCWRCISSDEMPPYFACLFFCTRHSISHEILRFVLHNSKIARLHLALHIFALHLHCEKLYDYCVNQRKLLYLMYKPVIMSCLRQTTVCVCVTESCPSVSSDNDPDTGRVARSSPLTHSTGPRSMCQPAGSSLLACGLTTLENSTDTAWELTHR